MKKLLFCAVFAIIPTTGLAQSVVCGGKIINEGVSQVEVSAKCGTPAQIDHHSGNLVRAIGSVSQPSYVVGTSDDIDVEVWTYNFGPNKLMQRIWFEGGLVKRVESLGYGF